MHTTARLTLSALFAGLLLTGMHSAITAPGDPVIAQSPLTQTARVKPAFIMAVDDSGSMNWEMLVNNQDGEAQWGRDATSGAGNVWGFFENNGTIRNGGTGYDENSDGDNDGRYRNFLEVFPHPARLTKREAVPPTPNFGFARSPEFNPAYFNPATVYAPWKKSDGTSYESMDTAAEWGSIKIDPRDNGDDNDPVRFDLDSVADNTTGLGYTNNAWMFDFRAGMVIRSGTEYYEYGDYDNEDPDDNDGVRNNECSGVTGTRRTTFRTAATDIVVNEACLIGIKYFPATYYLTTSTSPDGNTAPVAFTNLPGGPRSNTLPGNGTLYRYEIKPGNYATGAAYTAAMTNFANYFLYYRTRNLALVAALTNSFDSIEFLRAGYFTINNRVAVDMYDLEIQADRDSLYTSMIALPAENSTPNRWAVEHIGTQFERTDADAPVQIACQANAGMLFTDGYSNQGGPAVGEHDTGAQFFGSSASNTMADTAAKYYTASLRSGTGWDDKVVVPDACTGDPNNKGLDCRDDPHMNFYGITLGALGVRYGVAPYINVPGTPEDEARTAAIATNPAWVAPVDDEPSAVDEIWHATLNGRGRFVNAKSPADVTTAMREILNAVSDSSLSSGSIAGAGRRVPGTSDAFVIAPSYAVAEGGTDWTGDVTTYEVNDDGSIGNVRWSAASQIPTVGRDVYAVTTPGESGDVQAGTFTTGNLGGNTTDQLAALGLTQANVDSLFPGATPTTIVDYLKGDTSDEQQNGGVFRNRSAILGDIVNSGPVVSLATDNYGYGVFDPDYATFLTVTKVGRTPYVYVGANDGMLHAFNGGTGIEEFAFIPNGVLDNMGQLPSPYYVHQYFVDGDPVIADAKIGGTWNTVLVGTTAAGGRSVYALDIDNPAAFSGNDVLWEFNSSIDNDLGYTFSKPSIVQLENDAWVAIFGNGYGSGEDADGTSNDPFLYVLDLATGAVLRKLAPDDNGTDYNGLGQTVVIDTNNNGKADTVYGGDLMGNVWKFDLSDASSANWEVALGGLPLFTATDDDGNRQPITGGLAAARGGGNNIMVYFGTGRYFIEGDNAVPADPPLQSIYGVSDNGTAITGGRGSLQEQVITVQDDTTAVTTRQINATAVNYLLQRGFFLDLVVTEGVGAEPKGEMLVGNPLVQSGAILFPTFEPLGDPCVPGGQNWLYRLNLRSGAPALDETRMISDDSEVCPSGICGALDIGTGAPQMDVVTFRPETPLPPGIGCDPADPACIEGDPEDYQCTEGIAPGGVKVNVVCGRQSWRQVR